MNECAYLLASESSPFAKVTCMPLQVALKLVPDSKTFMDILKENDESYDSQMEKIKILVSMLGPFLEGIHCILVSSTLCFKTEYLLVGAVNCHLFA